ncbi:hypothetical protein [Mycoplasmopsis mustelae]|nr:hypothetical protein [Mycoplasmopsis mustelae]
MFLTFRYKTFGVFKITKGQKQKFKLLKKLSKYGVASEGDSNLFLSLYDSELSQITIYSHNNLIKPPNSWIENNDKYLVKTNIIDKDVIWLTFKFIPAKYVKYQYKTYFINKEFFFALQLLELSELMKQEVLNIDKINQILKNLKFLEVYTVELIQNELLEYYRDAILQYAMFSLVDSKCTLIKTFLQPIKTINFENLKDVDIYLFNSKEKTKTSVFQLIQQLESKSEIIKLRKAFNNDYNEILYLNVERYVNFDFYNPILEFRSKKSFHKFLNENKLNATSLFKNYKFIYDNEMSIDKRELFLRCLNKKYNQLIQNTKEN